MRAAADRIRHAKDIDDALQRLAVLDQPAVRGKWAGRRNEASMR